MHVCRKGGGGSYFLSLIPWFGCVTGPEVHEAGVETGLADLLWIHLLFHSRQELVAPPPLTRSSPYTTHCPSRWALLLNNYPPILHSSWLPRSRTGWTQWPCQGCFWGGKQLIWVWGHPLGGSAGAEMDPVSMNGSLVTTGSVRDTYKIHPEHCQTSLRVPASLLQLKQLHASTAIVKIKMDSIFTATLFRSSELNRRGRVIIGAGMCKWMQTNI